MEKRKIQFIILLILLSLPLLNVFAAGQPAIIRAVLFYSPTCPHCLDVIQKVLPPLVDKYPDQLDIVGVDVSHPVGNDLYQAMVTVFKVPDERLGVPALVIGSTVLVGTSEIEVNFPELIKVGISTGGFEWPNIPGLNQVLTAQKNSTPEFQQTVASSVSFEHQTNGFIDKFMMDPVANSIAVIVLIGMILVGLIVLRSYLQGPDRKFIDFPDWVIPVLSLLGLGVAIYLSYIEVSEAKAVCGPLGNCNSVQQSPYATLFGLLPVGVLGAAGYLAIIIAWLVKKFGPIRLHKAATLAIWGMAWFGLVFSVYLTFLEPFVIGATCAWCITSAILITLILLASTSPAKEALRIEVEDDEEESSSPGEPRAEESLPPA